MFLPPFEWTNAQIAGHMHTVAFESDVDQVPEIRRQFEEHLATELSRPQRERYKPVIEQ